MTTARIFIAVVNYSDRVHCNNRAPKAELVQLLLAIEWTLATALAVVIAHLAIEIAGSAWLGYGLLFLLPLVGGILGGLPIGFCQWLVLRRHIADNGSWIVLTTVGFFSAWI